MASNVLLYDFPLAFNPGKARLALVEAGIPYKAQVIDLFNGASLAPSFIRVNPNGTVPAMAVNGGAPITESKAIVQEADKMRGEPLGGAQVDRALVQQWLDKIDAWDGNLYAAANSAAAVGKLLGGLQDYKANVAAANAKRHPDLAETYNRKVASIKASGEEARDSAKCEANRKQLDALLDEAEAQLGRTPYLAGQAYSMADVMMTPVVFRTGLVGKQKEVLASRPKLAEWWNERIKTRPSYQKVFGPALSKGTAAGYLLPALVKSKVCSALRWY